MSSTATFGLQGYLATTGRILRPATIAAWR